MNNANLERKISFFETVGRTMRRVRGMYVASAALALSVVASGCGDDTTEPPDDCRTKGCEKGYHCELVKSVGTCTGGRDGEREYDCVQRSYQCKIDW